MDTRSPLAPLARAVLAAACATPLWAQAGPRDNVLIIVADDVGVDNVGIYGEGAAPPPTPTLDALARRGVLFRNAWSNPVCSPTRACIHTGRYSYRTGVGSALPNAGELRRIEVILPEQLDFRSSGYAHAAIGKWHLTNPTTGASEPNLAGWSHYAGLLLGAVVPPFSYFSWPRTVDGQTALSTTYTTTQMVDDALAWIGGQSGPWVCYLAFNAAHSPFHAPPAALHTQNLSGLSPETEPIPFYKAMVEAMDTEIGRLLGSLGPALARTNVIFIGDNGTPGQVSEPPFLPLHAKGTPYEGGVNVPLIVAGPAVAGAPREETALVGAVDLFATVLELAGVEPEPLFARTDSVSLAPYLAAPGTPSRRTTIYAELFDASGPPDRNGYSTVRTARYKLIQRYRPVGAPAEELYDLLADPFETVDLLLGQLTPQQRLVRAGLAAEIAAIRTAAPGFVRYGTSTCVGSGGTPSIRGLGTPALGSTYAVALVDGAPSSAAVLTIGGSDTYFGPLALPFPLALVGSGPGCFLFASVELSASTTTDPGGSAMLAVGIPNEPWLLGGSVRHQWLIVDPNAPANPLGLTASGGLRAVLGDP